jgi:hypothetical protein
MSRKPLQKGGQYFEFRNGLGGFSWEGMATKVDPGGNPPNRPRFLGNTRIQGGVIVGNPPYRSSGTIVPETLNLNPLVGNGANRPPFDDVGSGSKWEMQWIGEHNSVGGTRLWWGGEPPLTFIDPNWVVINGGAFIGFIDTDDDPPFQEVAFYPAGDSWTPSIEKFDREIYMGDFGKLRKLKLIRPPAGLDPADILSAPADETIATFPGFRCSVLQEYNGRLYFLLTDPFVGSNAEIWSWDGFQVVQEFVTATTASSGSAAFVYKNQLVFTLAGYGSIVFFDPAGGWQTATLGGFDSSPFLNSMAQYRDKLYIMDGIDKIHSWDGTSLALEHTIAPTFTEMGRGSIVPIAALAFCCAVLADRFYFAWTDVAVSPNVITLGCLDGKTDPASQWINNYQRTFSITDLGGMPAIGGNGTCTALGQYRGRLWGAFGDFPVGNSQVMTHSVQFAPYDGWFRCDGANGPGTSFGSGAPFPGKVPINFLRSL